MLRKIFPLWVLLLALLTPQITRASWQAFKDCHIDKGEIFASVIASNGDIYIAGHFDSVNQTEVNNIARWNHISMSWEALGEGIPQAYVYALHWWKGRLLIGGMFSFAEANARSFVSWSEAAGWSNLGCVIEDNPFNFPVVYTITSIEDTVIIGGSFVEANKNIARNILKFNGTIWEEFNGGVSHTTSLASVRSLCISKNSLWIGGSFTKAGEGICRNLAIWNFEKNSWETEGVASISGTVYSIYPYDSKVFIGGHFRFVNGQQTSNIACFTGKGWQVTALEDQFTTVYCFGEVNGSLLAGGQSTSLNEGLVTGIAFVQNGQLDLDNIEGLNFFNGNTFVQVNCLTPFESGVIVGGGFNKVANEKIIGLAYYTKGQSKVKPQETLDGQISNVRLIRDCIEITLASTENEGVIAVYNILGYKIYSRDVKVDRNKKIFLNGVFLTSGVYYISWLTSSSYSQKKIYYTK